MRQARYPPRVLQPFLGAILTLVVILHRRIRRGTFSWTASGFGSFASVFGSCFLEFDGVGAPPSPVVSAVAFSTANASAGASAGTGASAVVAASGTALDRRGSCDPTADAGSDVGLVALSAELRAGACATAESDGLPATAGACRLACWSDPRTDRQTRAA